ncbi:TPA: glycosyltransferase family 4 protein [Photobacterium damselae]
MKIKIIVLDMTLKGGIERVTSLLSKGINDLGVEVEIISIFNKNKRPQFILDKSISIKYLTDSVYNTNGVFNKISTYSCLFYNLFKYVKRQDIDTILISNYPNISIFLGFIRKFFWKGEFIASEHSQYAAHSKYISLLRRIFYSEAKYIVTLTKHDKQIFDKYMDSNIIKNIPNPVSFSEKGMFSSLMNKRLITIGRLEDVKGYIELIDSIKFFFIKHPDWTLDIYGDGPLRLDLENKIIDNNLTNNIFLKGFSNNLESELKGSSYYICSSKTEAFPMSFLEVLSLGIPVISLDCPVGPREIIENNINGFIVNNLEAMNNKLLAITKYEDYSYLARNAVISVDKYSLERIANKWIELLND